MKDDGKVPAMNPEQAADLAALEAMAAPPPGISGDAAAAPAAPPGRPELQAELQALFTLAAQTIGTIYPSVKETCNPPAIDALAAVWAAVCNKRGWLAGGIGGEYAEELAAAAVTLPLGFGIYKGIQADIAARARAEKKTEAIDAPAEQGEPEFSLGAAVEPAPV